MNAVLIAALLGASVAASDPSVLQAKLQKIVEHHAKYYNVSFSAGITYFGGQSVHAVAGVEDYATGAKATVSTMYPLGSVTKTYTTTAALRLAEAGKLDLDAPIAPLVDPFLMRTNKSTMAIIFPNEPRIAQITMRQLLSMQSGMPDYDDQQMRAWSTDPANVGKDITPLDYLWQWCPKTLLFNPGNGSAYSSVGYDLAGLVLAAVTGANTWTDFNQKAAILPAGMQLPHITFPLLGPCTKYTNVSHSYTLGVQASPSPYWYEFNPQDIASESCLNGWTCGNIAAAGGDLARALYAVLSPNAPAPMLSASSVAQMKQFKRFSTGWSTGLAYGLGLMKGDFFPAPGIDAKYTTVIGHPGQDYGSGANLHFYNEALDFTITLLTNSVVGNNCSLSMQENSNFQNLISCQMYAAALDFLTNGSLTLSCGGTSISGAAEAMATAARRRHRAGASPLQTPGIQAHTRIQAHTHTMGGLVGAASGSPPDLPLHCATSPSICSGASANLAGADCYAWKSLHAATGGSPSASGARAASWAMCRDAFEDPCSCAAVGCSADGKHITSLKLKGAGLVGSLPVDANGTALLAQLPLLTHLDLSSNELFGKVPLLPFGQYTVCDVSGNDFDCPLPPGAAACHPGDLPDNTCWPTFAEVTPNCGAALGKIFQSPRWQLASGIFQQREDAIMQPMFQSCNPEIMAEHTCHLDLNWTATPQRSKVLNALKDTLRALDQTAKFCLLRFRFNTTEPMPTPEGRMERVEIELFLDQVAPLPIPQACTPGDRVKVLEFMGSKPQCLKGEHTNCGATWARQYASCSTP